MTKKLFNHKKILPFAILVPIVAVTAAILIFLALSPAQQRADFKRISSESYDTAFLSMYPIDYYEEEDFAYWRGMNCIKTSYCIPNFSTLKNYMKQLARSGNTLSTIYLGVCPDKLDVEKFRWLLQSYPSAHFEIILPYPSLAYWARLSEEECTQTLQTYQDFVTALLNESNASFYFFGSSEWLIANPANYKGDFLANEEVSETIMLHSDSSHSYVLTNENVTTMLEPLHMLIEENRSTPVTYPDLSGYDIVFFGDSIIGNFTGSASIPGVVEGLTQAKVYNLGFGGATASEAPEGSYSLADIATGFVQKDLTAMPADTQVYAGMEEYLQNTPQEKMCFVINYGLNDYFVGAPVVSSSPDDTYSYTGALRTAVKTLQAAYPEAVILLNTPNFTALFDNGMEPHGEGAYILKDYADALTALSLELNVGLLDNFQQLEIVPTNHGIYLSDGCHPNEAGRFLMGQKIAWKLGEQCGF